MSKNNEHFPEVHIFKSDDHGDNNLSAAQEFSTSEALVVRQEQPLSDSIPVVHSSHGESHCTTGFSTSELPSCEPPLLQPIRHYASSVFNLFSSFNTTPIDSDLRFDRLQEEARLRVMIHGEGRSSAMAAYEEYLLYCPPKLLRIIDLEGTELMSIERHFNVSDICWSSYRNQFLILSNKLLYSLDLVTKQLVLIQQFDRSMSQCTCYADTFIVSPKLDHQNTSYLTQVYNMSPTTNNWTLVRQSDYNKWIWGNRCVAAIRFNNNGSRVALVIWNEFSPCTWFQLYGRYDLAVPQNTSLLQSSFSMGSRKWHILSLPDDMFLLNAVGIERKLLLIDKNSNIRELKILSNSSSEFDDFIYRTAFIAGGEKKCFVVQTMNELLFYDL